MEYTTIGQPTTRIEGYDKVTGATHYTADVALPGTLWGRALRSPLAHARIVRVDTSQAQQVPGVHAVLIGADVRGIRYGRRLFDVPVLAEDRVRFVGERVAAVAAEDRDAAEEALALIDVEYEELPAVFDSLLWGRMLPSYIPKSTVISDSPGRWRPPPMPSSAIHGARVTSPRALPRPTSSSRTPLPCPDNIRPIWNPTPVSSGSMTRGECRSGPPARSPTR